MSIARKYYHQSQRGYFAGELYNWMEKDSDIFLLTGDLGYKVWDKIIEDFPNRFLDTGAAEQTLMDIAVGLALAGKRPFVYSITPFLLWRPAETIRNYINREKISVRLVASGRGVDYRVDGFSHFASDDKKLLNLFPNIITYYPQKNEDVEKIVEKMVKLDEPSYINLRR